MAPLVLEGETLGQKHQSYNKLVKEALNNNQLLKTNSISEEDDIQNLVNIDIAGKNLNVDFILEVLKSEDQLCVSKAIKRSTWLITDPQYAHIINPEHLHTQLKPQMTTKAFNKLLLSIRLHLTDETRVEAFYKYLQQKDQKMANKWLQHCSLPFVEKEIQKHHNNIHSHLLRRLFERSLSIYEIFVKETSHGYTYRVDSEYEFLVHLYHEKFLDLLESLKHGFTINFTAKATKCLMGKCPQRILDKFEIYGKNINLATFAKCLKKNENPKDFLLKHAKNEKLKWLYTYDKIQHFIKHMPKEGRFEFVKKVFIDKDIFDQDQVCEEDRNVGMKSCCETFYCSAQVSYCNPQNENMYIWYRFAPFDVAYVDLKKLIRAESLPQNRNSMLQVLITCAGKNMQHIHTVLQFYHDKHINEPFRYKIHFMNIFLSKVATHNLNDKAWDILNQIFHSMEVYIESENDVQSCVKAIIVRHAIRNEEVPEIVKIKFVFDTLKTIQSKLNTQAEKDAVFDYLLAHITKKLDNLNVTVEPDFNEALMLCGNLFYLIKDWRKELHDYPYAIDHVRKLIKSKKENAYSASLSSFYNVSKSWKKTMFEESISLNPSEGVCINAIKYDPGLLTRNKAEIAEMCSNDALSLRQLLKKIRIYWSDSLAEEWKIAYLIRLSQPGGHKSLIVGLCTLLPPKQFNEIVNKYVPTEFKIDWKETDQLHLSLRKQIAKNMHLARPLAPVEGILKYAKGDYLQYTVPSINAVLSQLSGNKIRQYLPKLLDAPVSLQKFGVRFAFHNLSSQELNAIFLQLWSSSKNLSIRTVIFTHTFQLLCKETNADEINETWEMLTMFIDKLTVDENKLIYHKLGEIDEVPVSIRPQFFMKSYTFLKSLPAKVNCERIIKNLESGVDRFIESLDDDFVVNNILKNVYEVVSKERYIHDQTSIISAFILSSKDEEQQSRRYVKLLAPLLVHFLPKFSKLCEEEYRVRSNMKNIIVRLANELFNYTVTHKKNIPLKTFTSIQLQLEKTLNYQKEYVFLTSWKIVVEFVKLLDANRNLIPDAKPQAGELSKDETDNLCTDIFKKIAPAFSQMCVKILKEDLNRFGSSTYSLFASAISAAMENIMTSLHYPVECRMEFTKCLLEYKDKKEVYLVVHQFVSTYYLSIYDEKDKEKFEELRKIIFSHPSDEIKMHFYELFEGMPSLTEVKAHKII